MSKRNPEQRLFIDGALVDEADGRNERAPILRAAPPAGRRPRRHVAPHGARRHANPQLHKEAPRRSVPRPMSDWPLPSLQSVAASLPGFAAVSARAISIATTGETPCDAIGSGCPV